MESITQFGYLKLYLASQLFKTFFLIASVKEWKLCWRAGVAFAPVSV